MLQNRSTLLNITVKQYAENNGKTKSPTPRSDKARLQNNALVGACSDWDFLRQCNIREFPRIVKIANTIFTLPRAVYTTVLVDASRM